MAAWKRALSRMAAQPAVRTAFALTIVLATLSACSGSGTPLPGSAVGNAARSQVLVGSDFKHVATWGYKGVAAIAQCPHNERAIAGGSSSSDGSFVGTGYPGTDNTSWVVKPDKTASAEAFATCISRVLFYRDFRSVIGGSVSGIASARCLSGFILVTGYNMGTAKASWFDQNANTYWVAGGGDSYALCARRDAGIVIKHAWNKSQKPKVVFAGCGKGYTVVGGAMGDTAWPGPPIQEHPGLPTGPASHGYSGWWTYSDALNELTWAACVTTSG